MKTQSFLLGLFAILLATVLNLAPAQAQASRTWVSGIGDDANPCSRTAPCKTFAGAISKTAAKGEINCLDPAGYGAVTITKAITIDCTGTQGSILVAGTNGIIVNAGASDKVTIRGISINGLGTGLDGIKLLAGGQLSVDQCIIFGFTQNGIEVAMAAAGDVYITNTYITNANKGVLANSTTPFTFLFMRNTSILNTNSSGFEANSGIGATIKNAAFTSTNNGVTTTGPSQINVESSTLINNNIAFSAAGSGSTIRVSNNAIYNNATNFNIAVGGSIASAGNNRITAGGATTPNTTISQQ